jgi:hypothetical protein
MPPLSYASNTVNEQARAAANRLWDPAAAPDLKPKPFRMPKSNSQPRKQHSHPVQPRPAASENSMFPVLPNVPPPARNVPTPQSTTELLSEKLALQQERLQTPATNIFSPMLRAPSPPSPRPDVRQRRPSSASVTPGMGIMPDQQRFGPETDEFLHEAPEKEQPAGSDTQGMPPLVSPSLQVPQQHAASESAGGQPSDLQASPRQQLACAASSASSPRSTRASGSGRHILARSVRLRKEGTTFQAHCSEAPSMWGAAALTRDLNR